MVHLPKIWIVLFGTLTDATAEAPPIRKELLILGTPSKQNVRSFTMSLCVRKRCGARTNNVPSGAG